MFFIILASSLVKSPPSVILVPSAYLKAAGVLEGEGGVVLAEGVQGGRHGSVDDSRHQREHLVSGEARAELRERHGQ